MRAPLLVLLLVLPGAALALPPGQDDAGSGTDAGDRISDALPVSLGAHDGTLLALPFHGIVDDPLLDPEDWYRVSLPPGAVTLRGQALGEGSPLIELRTPSGKLATWIKPGTDAIASRVYAPASGDWFVRAIQTDTRGGAYRFEVTHDEAEGLATHGTGYAALQVDVPPGGSMTFDAVFAYATHGAPLRRDIYLYHDGDFRYFEQLEGSVWLDAGVVATGIKSHVETRISGWAWFREEGQLTFQRPGRYHFIVLGSGDDVSVSFLQKASSGGATSTGTSGPLLAARPTDFDATLAAGALAAGATLGGTLHADLRGALVGTYSCSEASADCVIVRPDGSTRAPGLLFEDAPGRWTFHRGASADAGSYPLFAADVDLDP